MPDLGTTYMGLKLRNPLVVASSSLTKSVEGVKRAEEAGAGAVVLKSLFEEQILAEMESTKQYATASWHPEALDYVENMGIALGPQDYRRLVSEAKKAASIPVIASLNCVTPSVWIEYARTIAAEGADGIELNASLMPSDPNRASIDVENLYNEIVGSVTAAVKIPVAVKIGPYFTNVARVARDFDRRHAAALVLFNRYYQLDIDADHLKLAPGYKLSSPHEASLPLRWISLVAGTVKCDIAASTGVHDGAAAVKMLLAGANAVQLCSTLYIHGIERIGLILRELEGWMKGHGFERISDFRGKLSRMSSDKPELYERLQYIKALVGIE